MYDEDLKYVIGELINIRKALSFKSYMKESDLDKYAILGYSIEELSGFWVIENKKDLILGCEDNIEFPEECFRDGGMGLFCESEFTSVDLRGADLSYTESLQELFLESRVRRVDMRGMDLTRAENLDFMFASCEDLVELKWDGIKFKNVKTINGLFDSTYDLRKIDLNVFKDCRIYEMAYLLSGTCHVDKILLDKLDVSYVINMESAFYNCITPELNLSGWNVRSIRNINGIFGGNKFKIDKLDMSCFDKLPKKLKKYMYSDYEEYENA